MPAPTRLLVIGDGNSPTGFARLLQAILSRLPARFEVHHLAVNHRGDPHPHPWPLYPAGLDGDPFGVNRVAPLVERLRPSLVLMVSDPWTLTRYVNALHPYRGQLGVVAYVPIEGGPVEPGFVAALRDLDRVVAYTEFGSRLLREAFALADPSRPPPAVPVIPHGLDTTTFHPVDRRAAKRAILPHRDDFQDSFVVFNGNRNQPRKRMDLTLKAFARFADGKPDNVKLYLHTGVEDLGWNVLAMATRLGIDQRLILTTQQGSMPQVEDERLNLIYNVGDVGVSTAIAEGWGLVAFEHAATGAPQVLPRHSSYAELWDGVAELVDPAFSLTTEHLLFEGWFVTPEAVAAALERLYRDPELRAERARLAYERAMDPTLRWDAVAARWTALLDAVTNEVHPA